MSKRSFSFEDVSTSDALYRSALGHADALLKAAESLKQELERLRTQTHSSPPPEKIFSVLKVHNAQILPATRGLSQDEEMNNKRTVSEAPRKIQKMDQGQESPNSPGLAIPHPAMLTKWTVQDIPGADVLPPLPPVLDPVLEKAARTHSGIANGFREMDYERLEWIGDAYLYLASSAFIYETFPNLKAGRCSQLRERLIKNENLSELTLRYGIDKRARLPVEYNREGRLSETGAGTSASKRERKKVLGDLLEAHAAAAILGDADGLSRVMLWLKAVWGATLKREICDEYKTPSMLAFSSSKKGNESQENHSTAQPDPAQLNPKVLLSQAIGTKGVRISYRDEGKPKIEKHSGLTWFIVGAYYDGLGESDLKLGHGGGISKKEAGYKAAANALENKKLIGRLQKLKEGIEATLQKA